MIKKLLFLFFIGSNLSAATHYDRAQLAKKVFGTTGIDLSLISLHFVEDLFHRIATSSTYEQQSACKKAAVLLTQEIEKRETSLATVDKETKEHIEHNLTILTIQKDHYERVARLLKKDITPFQKIIGWLKNTVFCCLAFILSPFKKYSSPVQKLTNDLVMYTEIERNEIFTNHKKILRLLVCQNKYNIPLIIRFWDYPRHRHRLLNGVKKFQSFAQPQGVGEALVEVRNALAEETEQGLGEVGAVIGNQGATKTLENVGQSFDEALQSLMDIDVEGLNAVADAASPEITQEVADGLASSTVEKLPDVFSSEIDLGEATETIDDAWQSLMNINAEKLPDIETDLEKTTAEAAGAQKATAEADAEAAGARTAQTGKQTINTLGESTVKASVEDLKNTVAASEAAAEEAAAALETATQKAEKAAAQATEASEAAAKAAQEATQASEDAAKASLNAMKKEEAAFAKKAEAATAKAEARAAKAEAKTAQAEAKAAKAASERDPENTELAQKAYAAEQKSQEASQIARIKNDLAKGKVKDIGEAFKNTAKAKEEAVAAQAKSDELTVNAEAARESEQIAAENAAQAAAAAKAAEESLAAAKDAVESATTALRIAIFEQATTDASANAAKDDTGEATEDAGKKLTKAEKKAKQKALKAEAKRTAGIAKEAAFESKAATKAAAEAAKEEQKAFENVTIAEENLAKAQAPQAIRDAQQALDEAKQKLLQAKEVASKAKEFAAQAKETAETTKEAAQIAAIKAFGPVTSWAEKGANFAKMMGELVLQMEIAMGSQMVATWQSAADALVFASLSQQRTMLMTKLNHFFSQLAVQQKNILAKINANFSAQIAVIASQLCLQTTSSGTVVMSGLLPALFAIEQNFVTQAVVTATVKSVFILNPMPDDQLFYESPMAAQKLIFSHTPFKSNGLSNSWYNPYRSGNWQFCSVDYSGTMQNPVTSFVQYGAQPFTVSYAQNGSTISSPNGDPTLAVQNSIFTEYIPPAQYNQQSVEYYTISVACTLLSEPYKPFMMGIMFNGARWISGVLDLHHQHRLFCIYAEPNQKPGTYNVGFAETFYQNEGQMNLTQDQLSDQNTIGLNAIWPAYQILSPEINKLAKLAKSSAATPITNPLATIPALPPGVPYIFTIETQPNQVILTISTSDGKILYPAGETAASLQNELSLPNQIQNLNGLTFLYHNIGFTAPGCSAQFCIKKPTDLCFSKSEIKTIQTSLNKGTS